MSVFFTRRGKAAERVNYAEWIKSDGNQYIILPYKPNQNTRIVCDCQMTDTTGASFAFGARTSYGDLGFDAALLASQVFYDYGISYQFADRTNTTERIVIDANRSTATFTGTTTTTITLTKVDFTCLYELALFALNQAGTVLTGENGFKGKVWSYRVYESDVLLYELWPCFDPDGVACMYDKVNREYHYNQGSGEFVAGNGADDSGEDVIKTIDFSYIGMIYTAEKGMTWAQYINSSYNQEYSFYASGSYVMHFSHGWVYYGGNPVKTTDAIIANAAYAAG